MNFTQSSRGEKEKKNPHPFKCIKGVFQLEQHLNFTLHWRSVFFLITANSLFDLWELGSRMQRRHKHRRTESVWERKTFYSVLFADRLCFWSPTAVYQLPTEPPRLFQSQHDRPGTEWVLLHHNLLKSHQVSNQPRYLCCRHSAQLSYYTTALEGFRRAFRCRHVFGRGLVCVFRFFCCESFLFSLRAGGIWKSGCRCLTGRWRSTLC